MAESRIHDSRYHGLCDLLSPYIVLVLNKRRISSNGRVRERKQRGRAHWGRGKLREGGRRARAGVNFQALKIGPLASRRVKSPRRKPGARGTRRREGASRW